MDTMMWYLELLGTIAFAISGAMEAMKKEMDLLGVIILGLLTAVGGGVLRDVIIGKFPPTAFQDPRMAVVAIVTSVTAFFFVYIHVRQPGPRGKDIWNLVLFISDSVGLGVFTVMGERTVQASLGTNSPALLLFVGVITGVGGGVMRDLCAGSVPYILRKHVYATASIIGAVIYLILDGVIGGTSAAVISMICIFAIRVLALHYKWNLPRVKI